MGTLPTVCGMGAKAEAGAHFPVLPATLFSQQDWVWGRVL